MESATSAEPPNAELVWSRYNAMIVAATVGLGFLGQLALQPPVGNKAYLAVAASLLGATVCVLWWLITSYGWALLHREAAPSPSYEAWLQEVWPSACQDPIWWCAHAVIALFYASFVGLAVYFLPGRWEPWACAVIALLIGGRLVFTSVRKLNIHHRR